MRTQSPARRSKRVWPSKCTRASCGGSSTMSMRQESGSVKFALAQTLGKPRAARTVGHAVAANPLAVLIPCHRVIHASGTPSPYRWGATRKLAIQAWESGGDG